jgi:hypothetical protein
VVCGKILHEPLKAPAGLSELEFRQYACAMLAKKAIF